MPKKRKKRFGRKTVYAERMARHRQSQTPEEAEKRKREDAARKSARRHSQTPEEVERRRRKDVARKAALRHSQTPEEVERRRRKDVARKAAIRQSQTPEEVERRKIIDAARKSAIRKRKRESQSQTEEGVTHVCNQDDPSTSLPLALTSEFHASASDRNNDEIGINQEVVKEELILEDYGNPDELTEYPFHKEKRKRESQSPLEEAVTPDCNQDDPLTGLPLALISEFHASASDRNNDEIAIKQVMVKKEFILEGCGNPDELTEDPFRKENHDEIAIKQEVVKEELNPEYYGNPDEVTENPFRKENHDEIPVKQEMVKEELIVEDYGNTDELKEYPFHKEIEENEDIKGNLGTVMIKQEVSEDESEAFRSLHGVGMSRATGSFAGPPGQSLAWSSIFSGGFSSHPPDIKPSGLVIGKRSSQNPSTLMDLRRPTDSLRLREPTSTISICASSRYNPTLVCGRHFSKIQGCIHCRP